MVDQAENLRKLVSESTQDRDAWNNVVALFSGRSGCGVTSMAINMAVALARHNKPVVLFDLDLGNPQIGHQCRINTSIDSTGGIIAGKQASEVLHAGPCGVRVFSNSYCGLDDDLVQPLVVERIQKAISSLNKHALVIIDLGVASPMLPCARMVCENAQTLIGVSTEDSEAVMDCYATIKSISTLQTSASMHTLINQTTSEVTAMDTHDRITTACDRFLNLQTSPAGSVGFDKRFQNAWSIQRPLLLFAPHCQAAHQFSYLVDFVDTRSKSNLQKKIAA